MDVQLFSLSIMLQESASGVLENGQQQALQKTERPDVQHSLMFTV